MHYFGFTEKLLWDFLVICFNYSTAMISEADPGVVRRGGSVEPPKVKQTQIFWSYFFE